MNLLGIPAAAAALAGSVLAMAVDPADQVRLLLALAAGQDTRPTGNLLRRAALVQLARAAAGYEPRSYDDGRSLQVAICSLLDAEIFRAGDSGEDQVYSTFRALRVAVARDLSARSDPLPRLRDVTVRRSLPASVLGQNLYGDGSRSDEILARNDVPHPLFMSLNLTVLDR